MKKNNRDYFHKIRINEEEKISLMRGSNSVVFNQKISLSEQ